ncbi:MAG: hypothetical protein NC337_08115 [Roseburia sp.]|nr:hypothetical protein [Roseburia sp.]
MKNRDKWIAIVFLIFIMSIPAITIARNVFGPTQDEDQLTEDEKAILENNGTFQDKDKDRDTPADGEVAPQPEDPAFVRMQGQINTFIEGMFGRTKLIAFNTGLTSILTGGTYIESTQTLQGKNDMFFYKTELDGHPIWDYMGINHFTEEELAAIAANLLATRTYLDEKGIEFYMMCMPNKEIIYEENMPDTIARVNEVSRGEQLAAYINANTDLVFVYPKDALLAAKEETPVYYSTDTHCNQKGSFVSMQELFDAAYGRKAALDSVSFRTDATDYSGDLVAMAGLTGKYNIDTVYVFEKESADKAQQHDQVLLFVGDSFGGFLSAVSKGYYKEVYWVYSTQFQNSMYEEYEPDVVIWEWAERYCEEFANPILMTK